jgi:hypothetical protein
MNIRNSTRAGACLGAIMAMLGTVPAHAEVNVTLGGFLAMESLYRSRSETADIGSSFNGIPFSNQPAAHMSELRGSARQSRLSLLVQGDADADTHLAAYYEMDFLGGAQTAKATPSICASAISTRRSIGIRWAWRSWPARTGHWPR